jgi:hypothetical protein
MGITTGGTSNAIAEFSTNLNVTAPVSNATNIGTTLGYLNISSGYGDFAINGNTSINSGTIESAHTTTIGNTTNSGSVVINAPGPGGNISIGAGGGTPNVYIGGDGAGGAVVLGGSYLTIDTAGVGSGILACDTLGDVGNIYTAPYYWNIVTSGTQALGYAAGYSANKSTLTTFTLPPTSPVGGVLIITGMGTGGWKIAQNAGNQIFFGTQSTTSGTGGSLASTQQYDCVQLVCLTANANWLVYGSVGNITVT